MVMAGLTASLVVPAAATDFPAATTPAVTWNMQGADNEAQNGSKWSNTVQRLAFQVPILMLQEVGPRPPRNSVAQPDQTFTTTDSQGGTHQFTVLHRTWVVDSGYRSIIPTRGVSTSCSGGCPYWTPSAPMKAMAPASPIAPRAAPATAVHKRPAPRRA
ncbi:hypothetical protein ABZ490_51380 [Streptomyces sp. NPDC005811]|uniref:hypothetical protein n=1 Tax=Streptomyces sp. NPDC005811 TaxID=3154565 RepID=UPI0033C6968E